MKYLEKQFEHKGFKAFIIATPLGHRCGYVEIPADHKYFKKDYDSIAVNVHGGLTYSDDHIQDEKGGWFIGFDCAHYNDAKDESIMDEKHKDMFKQYPALSWNGENMIIWTAEMVEEELKQLIEQL